MREKRLLCFSHNGVNTAVVYLLMRERKKEVSQLLKIMLEEWVLHATLVSNWLPVCFEIDIRIILLAFKILKCLAPSYFCDLLKIYNPVRALQFTKQNLCEVPRSKQNYKGNWASIETFEYLNVCFLFLWLLIYVVFENKLELIVLWCISIFFALSVMLFYLCIFVLVVLPFWLIC